MKKRKLFLGVLLAAAAIGMTACTNNNSTDDNNNNSNSSVDDGGSTEVTKYTVTFDTNGGSSVASVQVDEGGKVTRPTTNPTKAADTEYTYEFDNWYKDSACSQLFNFDTETISANTTIYAGWTETAIEAPVTYIALNVNSTGATKEFQLGQKLNADGIVVTAITDEGDSVTLTASQYTVTAKDPSNAAFDLNTTLTTSGSYTIIVAAGDISQSYQVVVKNEQYKFTIPFSADSYNASLETPYTGNDTIPAGDYTWLDNRALKIEYSCTTTNGKLQVTDSNGNSVAKTYGETTYNSRFQINAGTKALFKLTPKVSGQIAIYFNTSAGRQIMVKDTTASANYNSATVTDANKDAIIEHVFDVVAGHTYEITSSTNGSNIYAIKFNASVDASERIETDKLILKPTFVEFDTDTNKFNASNPGVTVVATDNYDNERSVALADCTVTVKDASNNAVTGEITTAGEYTVTVEYDGASASYTVNVVDLNAPITAIDVNTDNVAKTFYQNPNGITPLNTDGIVVTGTKGGVEVTLAEADYTVQLKLNKNSVPGFSTSGTYTVVITSTEDTSISTSYDVEFYAIEEYTITPVVTKDGETWVTDVQVGSTKFIHNTRLTGIYHDNLDATKNTKVNLDDQLSCTFYSDAACTTSFASVTEAFANAGTVYAKLSHGDDSVVIVVTVKNLTTFTWDVKTVDPVGKKDSDKITGDLDNNFELIGNNAATVRLSSDGSKATSIELGKNLAAYVKVVLTGPATIVIKASSTNDSNTTAGWGIFTDVTTKTLAEGVTAQDVTGKDQTLSFTITAAGTYYIGYTETGRNGRLQTITVTY